MNHNAIVRGLLAAGLLAGAVNGLGCYGSAQVPVHLETKPEAAVAYLVPMEEFEELKIKNEVQPYSPLKDNQTAFKEKLEPFRVKTSKTPADSKVLPYQTWYVVQSNGQYRWTLIKPTSAGPNNFSIDLNQ